MAAHFQQVDVFTAVPFQGNPVAVVFDADQLTTSEMQKIAHWTNLSETTFLLAPTNPAADYRVRIFTPTTEFPFAGHPTIGSCHAWLARGGSAQHPTRIVQECEAGLITLKRTPRLAFAAPPLTREGPVDGADLEHIVAVLGIERHHVADSSWVDNGPGWVAVLLTDDAPELLTLEPTFTELALGVVARRQVDASHKGIAEPVIDVRAFFPKDGSIVEDPVTGSLNASVAQWLIGNGTLAAPYVARQGTALGRDGRVYIDQDPDGTVWVGGDAVTCIGGTIEIDLAP